MRLVQLANSGTLDPCSLFLPAATPHGDQLQAEYLNLGLGLSSKTVRSRIDANSAGMLPENEINTASEPAVR